MSTFRAFPRASSSSRISRKVPAADAIRAKGLLGRNARRRRRRGVRRSIRSGGPTNCVRCCARDRTAGTRCRPLFPLIVSIGSPSIAAPSPTSRAWPVQVDGATHHLQPRLATGLQRATHCLVACQDRRQELHFLMNHDRPVTSVGRADEEEATALPGIGKRLLLVTRRDGPSRFGITQICRKLHRLPSATD